MSYDLGTGFLQILPEARGFITKLKSELKRIQRQADSIKVDLELDRSQVDKEIADLKSKRVTVGADLEIARAERAKFDAELKEIESRAKINVDVDVDDDAVRRASASLQNLGSRTASIARLAGTVGILSVAMGGLVGPVGALVGGLVAVGGAAGGAAVAGIGALALAYGALKVATQGIGDALSGDAEALAKLTPAAREFVGSINGIREAWTRLGATADVQESLFAGIGTRLQGFVTTILPQFRDALMTVADGFNEGAVSALKFLQSAEGIGTVRQILDSGSRMAANFGSALGNLVPGLSAIMASATRVFAPLTDGIASSARELSEFLTEANADGTIDQFFRNAIDLAKQFGGVLQQVGGIIGAVFSAASMAGDGNALAQMAETLRSVNAYFSGGEGKNALVSFFQSASAAMREIVPVLLAVAGVIGTSIAPIIADLAQRLGPVLVPAIKAVGEGIRAAGPQFSAMAEMIAKVVQWVTPLLPLLVSMAPTILAAVGAVKAFSIAQGVLNAVMNANPIVRIVTVIGLLVSGLIYAYQHSETFRNIVDAVWKFVKDAVKAAWENVLKPVFDALVKAFQWAWEKAQEFAQILGAAWDTVKNATKAAVDWVVDKWTGFVETMKSIPAKVKSGLSGMWDFLKDGLKSALNWAIDKLNGFIGTLNGVTSKIPGIGSKVQLSTIPHLASGGLAGVGNDGVLYGPAQAGVDSILAHHNGIPTAVVAPGEYVSDARTTARFLPLLQSLPHLANGGLAGYGLAKGSNVSYGQSDRFPEWVRALEAKFGVQASTYAGHQESDRGEAGYAPNPKGLNRGIDFSGSTENLQKLAEYLQSIAGSTPALEQLIWQNPTTGKRIGWAGRNDVSNTGYYTSDYAGHQDHVHLRASDVISAEPVQEAPKAAAVTGTPAADSDSPVAAPETSNSGSTSSESSINTKGLSIDGGMERFGSTIGEAIFPKGSLLNPGDGTAGLAAKFGLPEYKGITPGDALGKAGSIVGNGLLAFFGLENSILSSNNVYNKAIQSGVAEGYRVWGPKQQDSKVSADAEAPKAEEPKAAETLVNSTNMAPVADYAGGSADLHNQVYAAYKAAGYDDREWADFVSIVNRESSWNPEARNPSSGAYGLAQFLGKSNVDKYLGGLSSGVPVDVQARGMMQYIKDRYGTPAKAKEFWDQNGWYDNGGWLQPGTTLVQNDTGAPEAILNPSQWETARAAIGQVENAKGSQLAAVDGQKPPVIGVGSPGDSGGGQGANGSVSSAITQGMTSYAQNMASQASSAASSAITGALGTAGAGAAGPAAAAVGPAAAAAQGAMGIASNLANKFVPKFVGSLGAGLGLTGNESANLFQAMNGQDRVTRGALRGMTPKAATAGNTSSSSDINIGEVSVSDPAAFNRELERLQTVKNQATLATHGR